MECSSCGQDIKITVGDNDLGRTVEVGCYHCGHQNTTIIGATNEEFPKVPEDVDRATSFIMTKMTEIIREDPEATEALEVIRKSGFGLGIASFILGLGGGIESPAKIAAVNIEPKVDPETGEVKPNVFTFEDQEQLSKMFKIKLDG